MQAKNLNWQSIVSAGLLSGLAVLYVSVIGMLETFNERDLIDDTFTLGQLLLYAPPLTIAFMTMRRFKDQLAFYFGPVVGFVVGFLTGVPLVALVAITQEIDVRDVFVNISRDLIEILTFDSEAPINGVLRLLAIQTGVGVVGGSLILIPQKIRRSIFVAAIVVIITGMMSELVSIVMEQVLDRDQMRNFFRRDIILRSTAQWLFLFTLTISLVWAYFGDAVRTRAEAMPPTQKQTATYGSYLLLFLLLLALPWLMGTFLSEVMTNVGLFVLMGLGLNIAIGFAGLLDLGYLTNYAVGAYVMAILTTTSELGIAPFGIQFTFWMALPISVLAAMLTGFIFAVPVLKMRGDYLAIATLGFGEIIRLLLLSDWLRPTTGGAQGIIAIPKPIFLGTRLAGPQEIYYVILLGCVLAVYISVRLNNSRTGRQWMAIREDEDVATAMGIDTARAKLLAFTLSAATGGFAGAILAAKVGTTFPNTFNIIVSINVLSLIIVGGMGSIPGVIVGAIFLIGLPELLREFGDFRLLIYGALLVVMMRARPEGFWPSATRRRELEEAAQHASTVAVAGD